MWTRRDLDIVETLTRRVRVLSLQQMMAIWWGGQRSSRESRRRIRRLIDGRLLQRTTVNAIAIRASRPLFTWRPDQPPLDSLPLSELARSRWKQMAVPVDVFFASPEAASLFGSTAGSLPKVEQINHDLLLSDAYANYRQHQPQDAERWVGEDTLPKAGYRIKDPDAFLVSPQGTTTRVIESAGAYGPKQISSFHEHCLEQSLPYELW